MAEIPCDEDKAAPSTPPMSLPMSPDNPQNVALHTPLKRARSQHPSFAPLTPQSLVVPKTPNFAKTKGKAPATTPTRKLSSINGSNWRVNDNNSPGKSILNEGSSQDAQSFAVHTTPNKPLGLFTPQVKNSTRDPLGLDISNHVLFSNPQARGSFTDPPPRRRIVQHTFLPHSSFNSTPEELVDIIASKATEETKAEEKAEALSIGPPDLLFAAACASCESTIRLSLLKPCNHHICASCITGSLNVVGEKDMICMHCHVPVHSFKISHPPSGIHSGITAQQPSGPSSDHHGLLRQNAFGCPQFYAHQPPHIHAPSVLPSLEASPPMPGAPVFDYAVLRVDNVPWDVTPPMIEHWLGDPKAICHVLLDRRDGRTMNHAYVETNTEAARAALRTHQNKILGHGRRSRAATLTLCGQEELMHALFPSWGGRFKGANPVYEASFVNPRGPSSADLLTASELGVMLHLIDSPKSHFLKVPCLAYWSLLSVLIKFPMPDIFAPGAVPDMLFDLTSYALEKYETLVGSREYDCALHSKIITGAIGCRAFTDRQLHLLLRFTNRPPPVMQQTLSIGPSTNQPIQQRPRINFSPNIIRQAWPDPIQLPINPGTYKTMDACDRVAQDFGLESSLVHALAERLALHGSIFSAPFGHL